MSRQRLKIVAVHRSRLVVYAETKSLYFLIIQTQDPLYFLIIQTSRLSLFPYYIQLQTTNSLYNFLSRIHSDGATTIDVLKMLHDYFLSTALLRPQFYGSTSASEQFQRQARITHLRISCTIQQ